MPLALMPIANSVFEKKRPVPIVADVSTVSSLTAGNQNIVILAVCQTACTKCENADVILESTCKECGDRCERCSKKDKKTKRFIRPPVRESVGFVSVCSRLCMIWVPGYSTKTTEGIRSCFTTCHMTARSCFSTFCRRPYALRLLQR